MAWWLALKGSAGPPVWARTVLTATSLERSDEIRSNSLKTDINDISLVQQLKSAL